MSLKNASSVVLLALAALALRAQAPPATPTPAPKPPASEVAGIPVNYDEAKAGVYTLPDALKFADGKPVRDAKAWMEKRRPEIVKLFESQQYGVAPGRPANESSRSPIRERPRLGARQSASKSPSTSHQRTVETQPGRRSIS